MHFLSLLHWWWHWPSNDWSSRAHRTHHWPHRAHHRTHRTHHRAHGAHRWPHHRTLRPHHRPHWAHARMHSRMHHTWRPRGSSRRSRGTMWGPRMSGWARMLKRCRGRDGCSSFPSERVGGDLACLEGRCRRVDQVLGLLLHPLLVIVLDIVLMLPTLTMRLTNGWRIVREVSVTIITIILRHAGG